MKATLPKLKGYTYSHMDDDFYGYKYESYGSSNSGGYWFIKGRDGDELLGDRLPSTEKEAKAYCRCANFAFQHAAELAKKKVETANEKLLSEL